MTGKEIIQALRCCADYSCSVKCPAFPAGLDCREEMHKEVLALIERLTAERDAALADLADVRSCKTCKYACDTRDCSSCKSKTCKCRECHLDKNAWEWRGLPEAPEEGDKHE